VFPKKENPMKSFAAAIALVLVALATTNVPASAKEEGLMTTLPSNGVTVANTTSRTSTTHTTTRSVM